MLMIQNVTTQTTLKIYIINKYICLAPMNLQHFQIAARQPKSKAPQTHKVPKLTYIADPFFSLRERKLRTDEKHDTSPLNQILPISSFRPQSATQNNTLQETEKIERPLSAPNKQRTAVDISKLHHKSPSNNSDKQRELRQKIKNLFSDQEESEDELDDDEFDIEETDKQKQIELTGKLLREKVERLKKERIDLENSWNANKYTLGSSKFVENELNALKKQNESDSEYEDDDDDEDGESIDSIMSFCDNDANIDSDDSNDKDAGLKTLSRLRNKQTSNLAYIEEVYNKRRNDNSETIKLRPKSAPINQNNKSSKNKNKKRYKITIPTPFEFDERDRKHKKNEDISISKRKFKEYIDSLRKEEEYHLNFEFKANPIPLYTLTQQLNGKKYKKNKKNKKIKDEKPFKATEVPWFVKEKLYNAMEKEENRKRKERIKYRANKLLFSSSLPPRMQLYENKNNIKLKKEKMKKIKKEHYKQYTFHPKINHNVPDFKKEHGKFRQQLENRKKSKLPIKPQGFSFCEKEHNKKKKKKKKKKKINKCNEQIEIEKKLKETQKRIKYMIANPPKVVPKSTRKFDAAVKLKKEYERKQAMAKFLFEQDIKKKNEKIKRKWKGVLNKYVVDNASELEKKRRESQQEAKKAQKENALHWKIKKKEMMKRVANRPLLLQECRMKMERERAKKKALLLVKESLQHAGIKNFDDFFDQDEMEQLRKMKAL